MMSWGRKYDTIALGAAVRICSFSMPAGWCPLDPDLVRLPVIMYSDMVRKRTCRVCADLRPEAELAPFPGQVEAEDTASQTGGWKVKWYHVQAMLANPFTFPVFLDVDAAPCNQERLAVLFRLVWESGAMWASGVTEHVCLMSRGNCSHPSPPDLTEAEFQEFLEFHERNTGVIVYQKSRISSLLDEWASTMLQVYRIPNVKGDQAPLRLALFQNRKRVTQFIFNVSIVCRTRQHTCRNSSCLVEHHRSHRSLWHLRVPPLRLAR